MNEKQVNMIKSNLDSKSNDELAEIWKNNNQAEYSAAGFEAVRRILIERRVPLPEQIPFTAKRKEQAEKSISETKIPLGFGGKSIVLLLGVGIFLFWVCVGDSVKDAIAPEASAAGMYSRSKELIEAGQIRVALDVIVVGLAGALCLAAGIWHVVSRAKAQPSPAQGRNQYFFV
ncbi:MAG: hypothetical protein JXM79_08595 [Sedimentisphaerales bacterium]|nr:hypothetical protein [Sedimentisphaerales bacterium]